MTIRFATKKEITFLRRNDRHISEAELENSLWLRRILIAEEESQCIGWLR